MLKFYSSPIVLKNITIICLLEGFIMWDPESMIPIWVDSCFKWLYMEPRDLMINCREKDTYHFQNEFLHLDFEILISE